MGLYIPNHLQGLSFSLKKRHPDLRRNVRFNEDMSGLHMDLQLNKDGQWRRVQPDQARKVAPAGQATGGPASLRAEDFMNLLEGTTDEERNDK